MKVISRGMPLTIAAQSPGRELLIHFVAQPRRRSHQGVANDGLQRRLHPTLSGPGH